MPFAFWFPSLHTRPWLGTISCAPGCASCHQDLARVLSPGRPSCPSVSLLVTLSHLPVEHACPLGRLPLLPHSSPLPPQHPGLQEHRPCFLLQPRAWSRPGSEGHSGRADGRAGDGSCPCSAPVLPRAIQSAPLSRHPGTVTAPLLPQCTSWTPSHPWAGIPQPFSPCLYSLSLGCSYLSSSQVISLLWRPPVPPREVRPPTAPLPCWWGTSPGTIMQLFPGEVSDQTSVSRSTLAGAGHLRATS